MRCPTAFTAITLAVAWSAPPCVLGAEKQQVAIFNLAAGPVYAQRDNPPCEDAVNIVTLLQDPARVAALTGGDPTATAVIVGTAEITAQISRHGGDIAGLVTRVTDGDRSRCKTGCVVLPEGARIIEIRVSNRSGQENWAYTRNGPNPHDANAPTVLKFGGVLNAGSSGDWAGWEGVQVSNGARAVCGTAKNWSHDSGTHQSFRVIYNE